MLCWICPECGRECSPALRDCPSCPPAAARASSPVEESRVTRANDGILALAQNLETIHAFPIHTSIPEPALQAVENGHSSNGSAHGPRAATLTEDGVFEPAPELTARFNLDDFAAPTYEAMLVLAEETLAIPVKQSVDSLVRPLVESVGVAGPSEVPAADSPDASQPVAETALVVEPPRSETVSAPVESAEPMLGAEPTVEAVTESDTAPALVASVEPTQATDSIAEAAIESDTAPTPVESVEPTQAAEPIVEAPTESDTAPALVESVEPTQAAEPIVEAAIESDTAPTPVESVEPTQAAEPTVEAVTESDTAPALVESVEPTQAAEPIVEAAIESDAAPALVASVEPTQAAEPTVEAAAETDTAPALVESVEPTQVAEPTVEAVTESDTAPALVESVEPTQATEPIVDAESEIAPTPVESLEPIASTDSLSQTQEVPPSAPAPPESADFSALVEPAVPNVSSQEAPIDTQPVDDGFRLEPPSPEPIAPADMAEIPSTRQEQQASVADAQLGLDWDSTAQAHASAADIEAISAALVEDAQALVEVIDAQFEIERAGVRKVAAAFEQRCATPLLDAPLEIVTAPAPPLFEWMRAPHSHLRPMAPPPANLASLTLRPQSPTLAGPCLPPELRNPTESQHHAEAQKSRSLPGWVISFVAAMLVLLVAVTLYRFYNSQSDSSASTPGAASPASANARAAVSSDAVAKSLEISGLRLTTSWTGKQQVRFLIINHSPQDLSGVTAQVTVKSEGSPVLLIQAPIRSLASNQSQEIRTDLDSDVPASALADWQSLRTEIRLTSQQ